MASGEQSERRELRADEEVLPCGHRVGYCSCDYVSGPDKRPRRDPYGQFSGGHPRHEVFKA